MPKKRGRRSSAAAVAVAEKAEVEVEVEVEEVVSSAKRRRASKGKRTSKRSSRAEAGEEGDGERAAGTHTPQQRTQEARASSGGTSGGSRTRSRQTAAPKRSSTSDDPFNAAATAAHLGLDITEEGTVGASAAATTPGSSAVATPVTAHGAKTAEPKWVELTPERMVRLGRANESCTARVLLRLVDAEFVVLEGFYRVRVLHGNVSVGAYTLSSEDGWQPVYAAATNAHYIHAVRGESRGYRADSVHSRTQHTVETSAAAELWRLAPSNSGAVVALESVTADGLAVSNALEYISEDQVTVLPAVEGRKMRELGMGLELCRLVPPPSSPSSPSQQLDSGSVKPSKMKPAIAPRDWDHAVSNVSRMHRLALASRNANAVAPIAIAVGAKNAGKSTLCQLLLNSLLAQRADAGAVQSASREEADGQGRGPGGIVAYLDLDPGQCEFTAAGMISLVVVLDRNQHQPVPAALQHLDEYLPRGPVLGPSHTHLHHATVRSCFIGSTSVDSDPIAYQAAIESLVMGYRLLCDAISPVALPLVVNTMGWVRGLGLQLLTQTIEQLRPTFLLALSSPQQQQQLGSSQATTPRGGSSPHTGADDSDESNDTNLADTSAGASFSGVAVASGSPKLSPKNTSRSAPTADERDIMAFRALAKQVKASFLPLPAGGGNDNAGQGKPGRVLTAVELRSLALLAYFRTPSACSRYPTAVNGRMSSGHSLSQWLPPTTSSATAATNVTVQRPLIDQTPYAIRWCDIRIGFTHNRPPNSQALIALNGSLVGLVIDQTQYVAGPSRRTVLPEQNQRVMIAAQEAEARGFPGILAQPPPHCFDAHSSSSGSTRVPATTHCVGLGIVSRIDPATKQIFVITPIPHAALAQVNTLVKGSIELPALMRSYDAAVAMQQWQQEKQRSSASGTPYYVLGAVASEGLGGGAMKARSNLERGGGGK